MARLVAPHIGAVHFIRDTCVKKRVAASNIRSVSLTAMIELVPIPSLYRQKHLAQAVASQKTQILCI